MQRIKQLFKKDDTKEVFEALIHRIHEIRSNNNILNLQAQPTGYSWLGVYNAGLSLFPTNTAAIPQYYSNQVLSDKQVEELGAVIGSLKFEQLIYNGYNTYFSKISQAALKENTQLKIKHIYHGFFAELADNPTQLKIFGQIVNDCKENRIHKIGFVKQGMAETFQSFFDTPCQFVMNKTPRIIKNTNVSNTIGVLTNHSFRKNTPTQVIAALSLKKYRVSVFESNDYDAFDINKRLIKLTHLPHDEFLDTLSSNIINSHVTFSESYAGQVFTESLAVGVPCLTSLTHGYLDDSEELRKALVVDRFDDAWAIAQKMEKVIADREHLSKVGLVYSEQMNQKADELLKKFLEE